MKVMLINPLISLERVYGRFRRVGSVLPPLGLCYIAAVLEREGYSIKILDANALDLPTEKILAEVKDFTPDLIGLTAVTMSFPQAKDLAEKIKQYCGNIPIVIGGPHLLGMGRETLENDCFDYGVIGEGEYTVLELVKMLEGSGEPNRINGLVFREDDEVVVNPLREPISKLDELPFPARHLLPSLKLYYPKAIMYRRLPAAHIFTSRGCPYQCIFCQTSFGKRIRYHSPKYVVSEIKHLIEKYKVREITINDDTFIIDKDRVYDICELMVEEKLNVSWSCNVRVNLVDKPLLEMMKKAGCWLIMPGVESGNQKVLDALKKGITLEQVRNTCKLANEVGLWIKPSFIIGNPLETLETIEETIQFAKSLPAHYPSFSLMTPYPGTELWTRVEEYGTFDKSDFSKLVPSMNPTFVPYGLNGKILLRKQKEAFKIVYLNPEMVLRHLRGVKNIEDLRRIWKAALTLTFL